MAMGTRKDQEQQEEMWIPQTALAKGASHPFYQRLNELLEESRFDAFAEGRCQRFYAEKMGRPSLALPKRIDNWSLASLQQRLVKTGGRLVKHARYYWLLPAESHLTRRLFGSMVRRIASLPLAAG